MASIYANRKNGKIVSFKFKACLGRDLHGKQIVKCTTYLIKESCEVLFKRIENKQIKFTKTKLSYR